MADKRPKPQTDLRPAVDAVVAGARVLVGLVAQSLAEVEQEVTLPQYRVLVMVSTEGSMNLNAVARGLDVHPSNATRTCDRLVSAGLVDRRETEADRRQVTLTLTRAGQQLVDTVMRRRRRAIERVLAGMPKAQRQALATSLEAFAAAAEEVPEHVAVPLGWEP